MANKPDYIAEFLKTGQLAQAGQTQPEVLGEKMIEHKAVLLTDHALRQNLAVFEDEEKRYLQRQASASILAQISRCLYEAQQAHNEALVAILTRRREQLLKERRGMS